MSDLEAFVLIGGRSSRMALLSCDKALLKIDGVTFAQGAVDTIREAFPSVKISLVARDEDQFAADDLPTNIRVIYDIYKDRGAYSGLHSALSAAKSEWIFVLACDYPFVSEELLKYLAGLIAGVFDAIVATQSDERIQPLCAFYRTKPCLEIVEKIISADEKLPPLNRIFETVATRLVKFAEVERLPDAERFFLNINSPGDLNFVKN
jgi:molybdopterin-guanine dinucleotide biosynthesis protein A